MMYFVKGLRKNILLETKYYVLVFTICTFCLVQNDYTLVWFTIFSYTDNTITM